ncbi:MAG: YciI family protein [Dehalococcoidia bacterium]
MLQILYDPSVPVDSNRPSLQPQHAELERELREQGIYLGGAGLAPVENGRRMRVKADRRLAMDGPFAESKEVLGGFFVVECKDAGEALEIATRVPTNEQSWIEVRRIGIWHPL